MAGEGHLEFLGGTVEEADLGACEWELRQGCTLSSFHVCFSSTWRSVLCSLLELREDKVMFPLSPKSPSQQYLPLCWCSIRMDRVVWVGCVVQLGR